MALLKNMLNKVIIHQQIFIIFSLFILIINSNPDKDKEIKLTSEMLNLVGCSKENFKKLIEKMNYKTYEKDNITYFKYSPKKKFNKNFKKKEIINSPFEVLKNLNLN